MINTVAGNNTKFNVGDDIGVLNGMLYEGAGIRIKSYYKKTTSGAVDHEFSPMLLNSSSMPATGNLGKIVAISVGASDVTRAVKVDQTIRVTNIGAFDAVPPSKFTTDGTPVNTATGGGNVVDRDGAISTDAINYVIFGDKAIGSGAETRVLINYEVFWEA